MHENLYDPHQRHLTPIFIVLWNSMHSSFYLPSSAAPITSATHYHRALRCSCLPFCGVWVIAFFAGFFSSAAVPEGMEEAIAQQICAWHQPPPFPQREMGKGYPPLISPLFFSRPLSFTPSPPHPPSRFPFRRARLPKPHARPHHNVMSLTLES
ncbi:hypothetical protein B0J18DRAFT_42452 [Chaetomium sp. MPI-SDFR-AT-0129]|nr:hypothetical protein B0J18DRAFT_42452 [Chaetomium sp. MPI-SDFR-AT-0129]